MKYLTDETIGNLRDGYQDLNDDFISLIIRVGELHDSLKNDKAKKFCMYGIARRVSYVRKCLLKFRDVFEKEVQGLKISDDERFEQTAYLSYFLLTIAGALDNIAWVVNLEKQLKLKPKSTTLNNSKILRFLSADFNSLLVSSENWLQHLRDQRDPVAHRIPPYVVPYFQLKDGSEVHDSYYIGDFDEAPLVLMHPQVISDAGALRDLIIAAIDSLIPQGTNRLVL